MHGWQTPGCGIFLPCQPNPSKFLQANNLRGQVEGCHHVMPYTQEWPAHVAKRNMRLAGKSRLF